MTHSLRKIRRALVPDRTWVRAAKAAYAVTEACRAFLADARVVGFRRRLQLGLDLARRPRVRQFRLPGFKYPLHYRAGTSDPWVVLQVFARLEYACVAREPDVRTVLDCGANIGCTAFYLLHRYPQARVAVVEPDAANMAMCRRNLAPFGDRVAFIQAGVWSASVPLVVDRGGYRDGQAWSFQVREAAAGERPDITGLTVPDLLRASGFDRADILKVDIEAAEAEVFRAAGWLDQVRTMVIELHGPDCTRAVDLAFRGRTYDPDTSGELTVYRNIR